MSFGQGDSVNVLSVGNPCETLWYRTWYRYVPRNVGSLTIAGSRRFVYTRKLDATKQGHSLVPMHDSSRRNG